jgi:hypothetical protein
MKRLMLHPSLHRFIPFVAQLWYGRHFLSSQSYTYIVICGAGRVAIFFPPFFHQTAGIKVGPTFSILAFQKTWRVAGVAILFLLHRGCRFVFSSFIRQWTEITTVCNFPSKESDSYCCLFICTPSPRHIFSFSLQRGAR